MEKNEVQRRILEEEDYIRCPKCNNSVHKLLMKHPDGIDDAAIARFLMITEEKVRELYEEAVKLLRKDMEDED